MVKKKWWKNLLPIKPKDHFTTSDISHWLKINPQSLTLQSYENPKTFSKIGFWIFLAEKLIWIFKPNISKNKNETLEVDFETLCGWVSIWTIYPGSKLSVAGSPSIEGNSRFLMDNPNIKTWMSLLVEYSKVLAPTLLLTTQAQVLSFDSDFNSIRTIVGNPCQRRPSSQCSSRWGKVF